MPLQTFLLPLVGKDMGGSEKAAHRRKNREFSTHFDTFFEGSL